MGTNRQNIEASSFRSTLSHFPTGVVVATTLSPGDEPLGMTIGSFASLSLEPPLVSLFVSRNSATLTEIERRGKFCVNVLSADQQPLAARFASPRPDRFADLPWTPTPSGMPSFPGILSWIECVVYGAYAGGDHTILTGLVTDARVFDRGFPLVFFQGGYGRFSSQPAVNSDDRELIFASITAERCRGLMKRLADETRGECAALAASSEAIRVIATEAAPNVQGRSPIGFRMPMIPPLCEMYIAYQPPAEIERWIARAGRLSREQRAAYLAQVSDSRDRGWALSVGGYYLDRDLYAALETYTEKAPTPAEQRRLTEVLASAANHYRQIDIDPDGEYEIGAITAPVFGPGGQVFMLLRLSRYETRLSGRDVSSHANVLQKGCAEMSQTLIATRSG
jgi:flavin reductase (DIM6/NTAB) family NADH-FMN oxidoreductase RutF/DNA-binding IclR family transcriptional regulator